VQYRRQATLRRAVLEPMAIAFFASGGEKTEPYKAFVRENPLVEKYARFRAMVEKHGAKTEAWPDRVRKGRSDAADVDRAVEG